MSRKWKLTKEERIAAVTEYLEGKGSYNGIARKYGIDFKTLKEMVIRAQNEGIDSLIQSVNKKYSTEVKLKAVTEYMAGCISQIEICKKYRIKSTAVFRQWISCYNNGKDFKKERTRSEGEITMNKGRKTTHEERIEIVAFCIENGKDYGLTMEKYGVSYQQIYLWVRKYEENGVEGLIDRRGKAKPEEELTEADRLRMENKMLQAKLKDMEMENKLLKKLRELRGGGR